MIQSVVGEATAQGMKEVMPRPKGLEKGPQIGYVDIGSLGKLLEPRKKFRGADGQSSVRTERRKNPRRQI